MAKSSEITPEVREIVKQKKKMERAEQRYIDERSRFRQMVADFLEEGGSPTSLGRAFDPPVTRGRIHQYRAAWDKEQARA